MKRWGLRLLACAGSGVLLFLSCADFDIWPLAWIGFVPALLALRGLPPRRAFLWGWLTGIVANSGGFYWITHLLMRFGHMHWLPSLFLFLLLAAYQGLHWGVWAYLLRRVQDRAPGLPATLLAPCIMTAAELVMPFIFPWYLAITQAWVIPVIQVADLAGPLGVTFLLMLANGMLYDVVAARLDGRPWPLRPLAAGAAVLAMALVYGGVRMAQVDDRWAKASKVKVGVVQANVGITEKGRPGLAQEHLRLHLRLSRELQQRGAELLVWPESSYPYAFVRDMDRDWPEDDPRHVMRGINVPLIFGVITYSRKREDRYPYNTAFMMEPDGRITGRFDKNFLLVFGEYIPFYKQIPQFKRYFPEASHFNHGTEVTTFPFRDFRLGPMICYEDIIPSFGRRLAELRPHLLVNITNDAWFGQTSEPWEHLALSVFRSVELRLGLVRAVNTGISAVVDATGRVYDHTQSVDPVLTPGAPPASLLKDVALLEGGRTVYAAVGDLFGYLNLALLALLALWPTRASREARGGRSGGKRGRRKRKGKRQGW